MIQVAAFTFNPFQENTYVLSAADGTCIIIDAGNATAAEDAKLTDYITTKQLRPILALNTHGHIDHLLGVAYLQHTFGIPFAVPGADRFLVEGAVESGALFGFEGVTVPKIDIDLTGQKKLRLGDDEIEIIPTPGHTPGHVSFFLRDKKLLFTGDTLFKESIGRTDLPGGDYKQLIHSILNEILPLGEDIAVHPGHGPATTLSHEVLYNPFLTEVINGEVNCQ